MNGQWIDKIKEALEANLPDKEAHRVMAPNVPSSSRYLHQKSEKTKKGAVLILFYEENGLVKFPLMLRNDYNGVHSGQVSLPGGRHEMEDQDLVQTALRETEEEIGVDQGKIKVLGNLSDLYISASDFDVLPVVGYVEELPSFSPDPIEVAELIQCDLRALIKNEIMKGEVMVTSGHKISTPYFDVNGHVVWGATAMMLSEMISISKGTM